MTAQTQTRPLTPRRKSKLNRVTATDVCILAFLLVFSGLVLYPFYNSVLISMTPQVVYIREPFMLWPKALDWSSYQYVFENKSIWMGMWTTVQITIFGTLYNIFLTVTMAYALNHSFPGKKAVIALIMFTMYFSGGLIPTYMMIKDFGLMNTLWSMILPTGVSISYLMVMRKFFKSIPDELEESAKNRRRKRPDHHVPHRAAAGAADGHHLRHLLRRGAVERVVQRPALHQERHQDALAARAAADRAEFPDHPGLGVHAGRRH